MFGGAQIFGEDPRRPGHPFKIETKNKAGRLFRTPGAESPENVFFTAIGCG